MQKIEWTGPADPFELKMKRAMADVTCTLGNEKIRERGQGDLIIQKVDFF